jgi:hypothetical protein
MFSITTAVTVRPTVSLRELMESSRAAWISVPTGSVRDATELAVSTLDAAAGTGAGLVAAEPRAAAVSGTAAEVSLTAGIAVSRGAVTAVSAGREAVFLMATALSITGEGTVSTMGAAVASVSDTTGEAVSATDLPATAVSTELECASAFGA